MKKICLLFIATFLYIGCAVAQQHQISGKITENNGEVVPFVSVFVKNTSKGVSANADGFYAISLPKGNVTLVFKAIGYKTAEKEINVSNNATLNQILSPESFTLNNVIFRPNAEDPAFEIIRQAIKKRKKYLNEVESYKSDVYIKGLQKLVDAPKKFLGRDMQKALNLDSNRKGILYLSESQSIFSFKRPNQIKEEMVSSKVSGRNNTFSFNKASDLLINFYENLLLENTGLSARSFVSPIADNALFYYNYKWLGTVTENGETINKIEVSPKRTNDPVFRGTVYIAEDSWRLLGLNLNLTKQAGINFVDTLNISQQYIKVAKVYMPSSAKFQFNGKVLGFKFAGYFIGIFNNYNVNPNFEKNYFTNEILKITKAVNKKDSLYWMNNRPIPLSQEEQLDYKVKDSIALRKLSKPYLDSLEQKNNKFSIAKLLLSGYSMNNRFDKKYIYFDPLVRSVFYNTVEGFGFKYGVTYRKGLEDRKNYAIRPEIRYGFSNRLLTGKISGSFYYDPIKRASVGASFGTEVDDLNRYGTLSLFGNSLNSLLYEKNLSKFYKKEFATISTTRELADGLQASIGINYTKNYTLQNTTKYKFRDVKDVEFTSNNPLAPQSETPLFPTYKAFDVSAVLTYTINQKYTTRPDGKFYEESKYPRIQLGYRHGIKNILGSDADYSLLNLEIYQERISAGLLGYSSFVIGAGKFLNNNTVYYPDMKHFRGNSALFFIPDLRKFRFLNFYSYSTNEQYAEAHFEHNFAGFITNKVPLLRKLKLEEFVGINYLTQPQKRNYSEYYFGLKRLLFSVSYGWAYDERNKINQGFRISTGF